MGLGEATREREIMVARVNSFLRLAQCPDQRLALREENQEEGIMEARFNSFLR
jgi:hypothetical protein